MKNNLPKTVAMIIEAWNPILFGAYVANRGWIRNIIRLSNMEEFHLFVFSEKDIQQIIEEFNEYKSVKIFAIEKLPECLKRYDYLAIQCFNLRVASICALRDKFASKPIPVCSITHTLSYHHLLIPITMNMLITGNSDSFLCTTPSAQTALKNIILHLSKAKELQRLKKKTNQIFSIPHGIDMQSISCQENKNKCREILGLPQEAFIIGSIGRISFYDKIDYKCLLEAFAILKNTNNNAILLIAGDDKDKMSLQLIKIAQGLNVDSSLIILKDFDDSLKKFIYKSLDVFVSLSNSPQESFGLTILEAMASGIPIIASEWDGYKYLIKNYYNGILITTKWSDKIDEIMGVSPIMPWPKTHASLSSCLKICPKEVSLAIKKLIDCPVLAKSILDNGNLEVRKYLWENIIPCLEKHWINRYKIKNRKQDTSWYLFDYKKIFSHYPSIIDSMNEKESINTNYD